MRLSQLTNHSDRDHNSDHHNAQRVQKADGVNHACDVVELENLSHRDHNSDHHKAHRVQKEERVNQKSSQIAN
jgi:hypothetical protein